MKQIIWAIILVAIGYGIYTYWYKTEVPVAPAAEEASVVEAVAQ